MDDIDMELKVIELNRKQESGAGVVSSLRRLLEIAENGEMVNFFGVALLQDEAVMSGWANDFKPFTMLGGIENAKLKFIDSCIEHP